MITYTKHKAIKIILILSIFLIAINNALATNVTACGTLNIAGENYVLIQNINATGQNCLTIGANNLTLNGMGYTIGHSKTTLGHAITNTGGYNNLIITNFSTIELNNTLTDHSSNGAPLYFSNMNNSTISYINMTSALSGGIYGVTNTNFNTFSHNTIISSSILANGIHLTSTSTNNTLSYNTITMLVGGTTGGNGIYLNSNNETVIHNIINTNINSGVATGVNTSSYNNISYNIVNSTKHHALVETGMNYSIVNENIFISNLDAPVDINYPSVNNTFNGNIIYSTWGSSGGTKNIMIIGDSISNYNRSGILGYGYYLQNLLNLNSNGWIVSTRGISGDTTQQMLTRYPDEMSLYQPTIITIMGGMNDIIQHVPQQTTINNILEIANQTKARGIPIYILLSTNSSVNDVRALNINLTLQATSLGYPIINMFDAIDTLPNNGIYDTFNTTNYYDNTHPNSIGQNLLGIKLYNQIYNDYLKPLTSIQQTHLDITNILSVFWSIISNFVHGFGIIIVLIVMFVVLSLIVILITTMKNALK